tara:strand:- start:7 stop:237 length:231 start_codon:yes stop_codon:yes gene_type:complete
MVLLTEKYSENETLKIWTVADKKYPFHAFIKYKPTGDIIEQAASTRSQAVYLAMDELKHRIKNNLLKGDKNEEFRN